MKNEEKADIQTLNSQSPILFIVGTTASGKSELAMRLAKELDGEIVCADSQTLRKHLDIGTAKPSKAEQDLVPHHLLDIIEPYERYSVSDFQTTAKAAIQDIQKRGKLPIVAGGSGLYIDSVLFDYSLQDDSNEPKRRELEKMSVRQLQEIIETSGYSMPENSQNPRHLIGVIMRGGNYHSNTEPINGALVYGMNRSDDILKQRIKVRIEEMFNSHLEDEVRGVLDKYGAPPQKLDAICYPIVQGYIDGEYSLNRAKELFGQADWQYARRQKAWFKRNKHITWFSGVDSAFEHILQDISAT